MREVDLIRGEQGFLHGRGRRQSYIWDFYIHQARSVVRRPGRYNFAIELRGRPPSTIAHGTGIDGAISRYVPQFKPVTGDAMKEMCLMHV